jgi:hypothetical protein
MHETSCAASVGDVSFSNWTAPRTMGNPSARLEGASHEDPVVGTP